ncbi:MAG: hypothetical protein NT009_13920 [Proteobacteria bacterium]|nr:hypothetical protein [Pseudomonadota bacterium]
MGKINLSRTPSQIKDGKIYRKQQGKDLTLGFHSRLDRESSIFKVFPDSC